MDSILNTHLKNSHKERLFVENFITTMASFIAISFSTGVRAAQLVKHIIYDDTTQLSTGRTYILIKSIMQIQFYNMNGETI